MTAPFRILLDTSFRPLAEIFRPEDLDRVRGCGEIIWGRDEPMPPAEYERRLPDASVVIAGSWRSRPVRPAENLRAIIEVGGHFPPPSELDYDYCARSGIHVLSCAPAFGDSVAEMGLALTLASLRGVARSDGSMRRRDEIWMKDGNRGSRTLYGRRVGFVGLGTIGRKTFSLLEPFRVAAAAYDPWLPDAFIERLGLTPMRLPDVVRTSEILFVTASPTSENRALLDRELLSLMPDGSRIILLSRAHVVDFDALTELVLSGRIHAGIDVFPDEPLDFDHPIRDAENAVLTPHQAGSLPAALETIGAFVADDVEMLSRGLAPVSLQQARPELARRL